MAPIRLRSGSGQTPVRLRHNPPMAIRYLEPVPPRAATGRVREIYAQVRRDFGAVVEPLTLHSPAPDLLAGAWCALRETLVAGRVPRAVKETVATAVSELNRCPWCVDAHGIMMAAAGSGSESAHEPYVRWAASTLTPGAEILEKPPFPAEEAAEIAGTALCFHYINRMVTVFLGDSPVPVRSPPLRWLVFRISERFFARAVRGEHAPGESLAFLPTAEPPPELAWAASAPTVRSALAGWGAAIERATEGVIGEEARRKVLEHLAGWRGEPAPLGSEWIEEALEGLDSTERPAASLAFLAARAPYRVGAEEVETFRRLRPADADLLAALAWGSYQAVRRVGSWIVSPQPVH